MISDAFLHLTQSIAIVSLYLYCSHLQKRLLALEKK